MSQRVLEVSDLKKHFPIRGGLLGTTVGHVYAVDGVSFHIDRGETLSLVGESGCGKSTVGKAVLRLFPLTSGQVTVNGKRIDVKSTRYKDGRLLATLKDNPDVDLYVLAIVDGGTVTFPGYATKSQLCREENVQDLGRGSGYVMTQDRLTAFKHGTTS
jgi:ABC-type dipeptide/oligopeptide/nickel transport system ATPase component